MSDYMHLDDSITSAAILYRQDVIVREAAVETVTAIARKVQEKAYAAKMVLPPIEDDITEREYNERRMNALENALEYATSALSGIDTALTFGKGGIVGKDDETGLFFAGWLTGAVIDRETMFTTHT